MSNPAYAVKYAGQYRQRLRNFELYMEYLAGHPCVDCGITNPVVLDLDHLPGVDKKFEVGRAVSSSTRAWKTIEAEIAKCEVVCANCHRIRTGARAGYRKSLIQDGTYVAPTPAELATPARRRIPHGGGARGRYGCKCEPCKAQYRLYMRNWNANHRQPATL